MLLLLANLMMLLFVLYSGHCVVGVWLHGSVLRPSDCPLCRRPITLLVPSEVASLLRNEPEIAPVVSRIEQYNGRFAGAPHNMIQVTTLSSECHRNLGYTLENA